jgi:hypothetical protein
MSDNIYDILGKLNGIIPKENPVSTAEPIYESIDPHGDIMSAVTQLEERYMGFKEAKAKSKRKEPEAVIPASDLTRSADPDVARLATKAKFIKPELNDFEAIVSYTSKLEKELEQAEKSDVVDRQKIEQTQQMLAKNQAGQDAMQKVITATDQRFRALNDKVASGQITAQDQKAAQAAQQIEKDADAAKAAVEKGATAPEQPTTSPEVPKDTNIYNFPDADKNTDQSADTTGTQGASNATGANINTARLDIADPIKNPAIRATPVSPQNVSGTTLPEPSNEPNFFPEPKRVNQRGSKTNEGFWKDKDIENQENPTQQAPQTPTTPEEFVAYNKAQVARLESEPNLPSVLLVYPDGQIIMSRATHEKVARGLSKVSDKILKNRVETDIYSHRDQLSKYINDIESAPGVDYYYFYNVKRGQEAKAFNIGLKQSKGGNWYNPRVPLPAADEIFGKGVKWTPGQPAQTTAESVQESLGNDKMKNVEQLAENLMERFANFREEAKPDFLDLDKDGDTEEPMKKAAKDAKEHEPAKPDSDAVAKRKRLQALKDKQEDERAEKDEYNTKSSSRVVKGRAYGGSAQKDDDEEKDLDEGAMKHAMHKDAEEMSLEQFCDQYGDEDWVKEFYNNINGPLDEEDQMAESGLQAYLGKKKYGKEGMKALQKAGREGASKDTMAKLRAKHDKMDEVAPPGAKAERMVKHIKKGYAKDGKLSKKEKGIAYATAWKARNKGQVEEATEFGDTIKNSKAEMKKHKMVKEGRNPESSEYTYETVGRILSDEQPGLDCNSEAFVKAVYDELIEMKMTPKAARWLVHYDEDFISDCASSYSHFCDSKEKEAMECGAPMNSFVSEEPLMDAQQELDEIAKLAGLPPRMESKCKSCGCADCKCTESLNPMVPGDSASPLTYAGCSKCNADPCCCEDEKAMDEGMGCSEEELNEAATRKDFRMVADLLKSIPDMAKRTELAMYHADIFKEQNPRFKKEMFLAAAGVDTSPIKDESVETEGNAFTGKLAATEKGGEFELDGKKFKDTSSLEEEEMGEGNEFSGALAKAKAAGEKEFEVDGKKYTVKEDININVSANGEEDVVNLIRKLSGMPVVAIQAQPAMAEEVVAEEGPTERDIEYANTPREDVAGTDAAIPAGADLNRAKRQYKKEYPGDNPMAESKEAALWKQYETMINNVKA